MKVALCSLSHPNNAEKDKILKNFGTYIKQFDFPTYLFSNYPIQSDTQKLFNGCYFSNYNPEGPDNGLIWHLFEKYKHYKIIPNWTYSSMNLLILGVKFLKSLGFSHFIFLSYDSTIEDNFIKRYIDYSQVNLKSKKGIFTEYEKDWINSLSTTQCACDIDFFLNVFEPTLEEYYNKKYSLLAENYWYEIINKVRAEIEILDKKFIIKTTYNSGDADKVKNIKYFLGYLDFEDSFLLKLDTTLNNFKIYNQDKEIIINEFKEENNITSIKFFGEPYTKFYLQFENCDEKYFLFEDTPRFRSHNFYRMV